MHSLQEPIKITCFPATAKRICLAKGKPIRHKHAAFFFAVACRNGDDDLKVLIKPARCPLWCVVSKLMLFNLIPLISHGAKQT